MKDEIDNSSSDLLRRFPDAESARRYFEKRRWGCQVFCAHCSSDQITPRRGKRTGIYRCRNCNEEFSVRTGTIFERSNVPLNKWLYAMYFTVTAHKAISSVQLSKKIGVTQKTAWHMLDRLKDACNQQINQ